MSLALRAAREAKSLTQLQVAEAMEWSLSKVMRIEGGGVSVSVSDLRALLPYLDLADGPEADQLLRDAKVARRERYSVAPLYREHLSPALLQLMQFEQEATAIRYFNMVLVPGVLQTPAYSAAIFRMQPAGLSEQGIKVRLEARAERQRHMVSRAGRADRPEYLVILDESVLYRELGGPAVMADQLRELLRFIQAARLRIRILPFARAGPMAMIGPFAILDMAESAAAILYREQPTRDEIVRSAKDVAEHREIFERLWSLALEDRESVRLIRERAAAIGAGDSRD